MSRTSTYLQKKAAKRIPTPLLDAVGRAALHGVDRAVDQRWEPALRRAERAKGDTVEQRVRSATRSFSRELVSLGAVAGASAAAPGVGTTGAIALVAVEAGWFALRAADLIMTIGAIYGRTNATREERRAWVLAILAYGDEAAAQFAAIAPALAERAQASEHVAGPIVAGIATGDVATVDALRRLNSTLAASLVSRYGSKRGIMTIGKLMPFGVGAAVGGGANWTLARAVSKHSRRFFSQYYVLTNPAPPPPAIGAAPPAPSRPEPPPPPVAPR